MYKKNLFVIGGVVISVAVLAFFLGTTNYAQEVIQKVSPVFVTNKLNQPVPVSIVGNNPNQTPDPQVNKSILVTGLGTGNSVKVVGIGKNQTLGVTNGAQKWEYTTRTVATGGISAGNTGELLTNQLNALGRDNWELVNLVQSPRENIEGQIVPGVVAVLKRPVPE